MIQRHDQLVHWMKYILSSRKLTPIVLCLARIIGQCKMLREASIALGEGLFIFEEIDEGYPFSNR